ncbi:MAG: hypothetical protein LBP73_07200 [Clostridiales Family XIII bacterium]|jgi:hypothetical protein|nr:hypothetical protein [Clostridiales Family XIII bacterium]
MRVVPLALAAANEFVRLHHRHHGAAQGCKFAVGAIDDAGNLRGVVITGRPVSRLRDDGRTAEVTRLCTDGCANACSFLCAAAARVAKAMGYEKIITYILESEDGTSLRASGWTFGGVCGGGTWDRPNRKRRDAAPTCKKKLYCRDLR